ncbi:MAG: hypothetical protein AAF720_02675 [Pseudomonadota bacterium]
MAKAAPKKTTKKRATKKKSVAARTPSALEAKAYNKVVESATIEDIRLIGSEFQIEPGYFADDGEVERCFVRNIGTGEVTYSKEERILTVSFEFSIQVTRKDALLLKCRALYVVFFTLSEEVDENSARSFAKRTGKNAAYPYFREFASSQSWASGADLPILPILKFVPPKT